jgi:rubrerythrin
MLGISRRTLGSRIKDEQQAQKDYSKDIAESKRKKDPRAAKVIGHIRSEEVDHEHKLRHLLGAPRG